MTYLRITRKTDRLSYHNRVKDKEGKTHDVESSPHKRRKIWKPVMLERYRIDDVDRSIGNGQPTEEHTVDSFVCIFESMNDEFSVGEISEVKNWD